MHFSCLRLFQRPIFTAGYDAMCHCHTCEEECTVVEILSVTDRKTGQVKRKQRFAKEGAMVTAKFKVRNQKYVKGHGTTNWLTDV